ESQREWRRDRDGPSAGRHQGNDPEHADRRAAPAQTPLWYGDAVRGRRHGHCNDRRKNMKTIKYELRDGIATITFDKEGSPVNTMCEQWQQDLTEVTAQIMKDKDAITGIILASAKTTFFAGADLKGTMRLQPSDAPRVFGEIEQTKKNFRTLETLGKPVVSCLNGSA